MGLDLFYYYLLVALGHKGANVMSMHCMMIGKHSLRLSLVITKDMLLLLKIIN